VTVKPVLKKKATPVGVKEEDEEFAQLLALSNE